MKKTRNKTEIEARSWQMSFNDLLTLMLVFFILLVSISKVSADKVQNAVASVATEFGVNEREDRSEAIIRRITSVNGVDASMVEGGVSLVIGESLLYQPGSADIINRGALTKLGMILRTTPGQIRIEGHTDSLPVAGGLFHSNWELSTQRAVNAVKFLVTECGMDPSIFSAAGYGDSRPIATNETTEGRTLNRRVNIILSLK